MHPKKNHKQASTDSDVDDPMSDDDENHNSSVTTQESSDDNTDSDSSEETTKLVEASTLSEADPLEVLNLDDNLIKYAKQATADYNKLKKANSPTLVFRNPDKKGPKKDIVTYIVYPFQYVTAHVFLKTTGITFCKAKMGSGKTLIACYTAMQCMRALIVVPTATLGPTWSYEIEEYGLFSPKPEETKIFIYDTSIVQSHRVYLENTIFEAKDRLVIICKDASVEGALKVFRRSGLKGHEFTVIIDESHMRKILVLTHVQTLFGDKTLPITREMLMSGSEIDLRVNNFDRYRSIYGGTGFQIDHRITSNITNPVPDIVWHFEMMESAAYNSMHWDKIIKNIAREYKHPVFVGTKEQHTELLANGVFGSKNVYTMTKAKTKIVKFESDRNAVMFLNKIQVTGMNINGDAMIITNPGLASTEYILQLLGRVIRPKNKVKEVHIYLLCGGNKEFFRCLYAKAFSFDMWAFSRDSDVNASMVAKGVAFIRALGKSPVEVNKVDLCVILADYLALETDGVDTEYMIDWWKKNSPKQKPKTILTADMIRDLVTI